ncbi:MAG: polysaccharide deacetylase family protein [Verrucomicrobia bacterium]|nr:polysaccharide deacetylase family protein [Verrucomicrobiota bacterium]
MKAIRTILLPALVCLPIPPDAIPAAAEGPEKPRQTVTLREVTRGDVNAKRIALTFDGGDEENAVAPILEALRSQRVRCTMFLTGRFIQRHPQAVLRMVKDGHEIGNHTFWHPRLTSYEINNRHFTLPGLTREFLQDELRRAEAAFERLTGRKMAALWRAPYGERNAEILSWAVELGYAHVVWTTEGAESMDTKDWVSNKASPLYKTADGIVQSVLDFGKDSPHGKNGAIVAMHLGTARRADRLHEKLRALIRGLQKQGYSLGPVTEVAGKEIEAAKSR